MTTNVIKWTDMESFRDRRDYDVKLSKQQTSINKVADLIGMSLRSHRIGDSLILNLEVSGVLDKYQCLFSAISEARENGVTITVKCENSIDEKLFNVLLEEIENAGK